MKLMKDMDDLLNYGVEVLSGVLKENSNTKAAFKAITEVIGEASTLIIEENKGSMNTLIRELNEVII